MLPTHFAADEILNGDVAIIGNVEANCVWRIVITPVVPVRQIVVWRTVLFLRLFALRLELLLGAVAAVGHSARQELTRNFAVPLDALGLAVRRVRAADVGSFIPLQSQPPKVLENHLLRVARGTLHVRVFDPQDESAAVVPGEEPVEDGRARAA